MKKQIKKLFQNPMILVFIIILIFFTPQSLYSPGQNREVGVVVGIGIDRQADEFEVSLLTFIPTAQQSYEQMNSVISGKGETVAKALYNAQIAMGRKVGLSHAKTTVVNQELLKEDVAEYIDYLSRVASLSENTVFICTDTSAKELLQASISLESTVGMQLEQIIGYNAKNLYVTDTSLEAFYKGYYSNAKSSLIGFISVECEDGSCQEGTSSASQNIGPTQINTAGTGANDVSSSGGSNGASRSGGGEGTSTTNSVSGGSGGGDSSPGGGSESSGGSSGGSGGSGSGGSGSGGSGGGEKKILNEGKAVLLKNGKLMETLSVDLLNGINLLNIESINQIITIEEDKKDDRTPLKYSYRIKNKRISTVTKFENGYPIYGAQLILGLELVEIDGNHENLKVNTEFSDIKPEIRKKIDQNLKRQFTDAIEVLRKNRADVIGINEAFFKAHRKEYKHFLDEIGGADKFLDYVNFKVNFVLESD